MRMMTWNVQNLFAPGMSAAAPTGPDPWEAKLASLAATINGIAPDVIALQEVGPPPALDDLMGVVGETWHTATADPDDRGIRVAIASRPPLTAVEQVTDYPAGLAPVQVDDAGHTLTGLGRPALKATITIPGAGGSPDGTVHVVAVHLKSKLLSFPGGRFSTSDEDERARYAVYALHRRAAEAAGVRAYATRLLTVPDGAPVPAVVVAGDLNDDLQAATTQILNGPPGSEIGTAGFDQPDAGDAQRLWNLAPLIPEDNRYSRNYRGRRELIDHIVVSAALVHGATDVDAGPAPAPSITDDPDARRDSPGSDHRPLHADLPV